MITDKVLYTDGHEVTVTDSSFKVKKTLYQLKGITKHGLLIIHPDRLPAFILMVAGAMMIAMGAFRLVPAGALPDLELFSMILPANSVVLIVGILFFAAGATIIGMLRERYAVRIATAEGEKNVVVSRKKEYVTQILDALNKAWLNVVWPVRERSEEWKNRISREIFPEKARKASR